MANVKPIPQGHVTVTPSITVHKASQAIDFYKRALGATERGRFEGPDKQIMHAEIQIGSAMVMLNADKAFQKAIEAGGKQIAPVTDMFWGDRTGHFEDPFGYRWTVATRVREMTPQEIHEAGEEWMKKQMAGAR